MIPSLNQGNAGTQINAGVSSKRGSGRFIDKIKYYVECVKALCATRHER